jgi:hypothetical protein
MANDRYEKNKDGKVKAYKCVICGKYICQGILERGCSDCENSSLEGECTRCKCTLTTYAKYAEHLPAITRELEELRYKLMLIEKVVYANNIPTIPTRKLKHILRGGWKYARERFL